MFLSYCFLVLWDVRTPEWDGLMGRSTPSTLNLMVVVGTLFYFFIFCFINEVQARQSFLYVPVKIDRDDVTIFFSVHAGFVSYKIFG